MDDIAVSVEGVYKDFRLPNDKNNSLKSHVIHPLRKQSFEKQHALKDINIEIKKGEFFGIVGRNGSGKSTLLKIIAGIYQPTKGKVRVAGKLVPFIELGVGFNPELSGRDNVYLNGALLGFSKPEIDKMYEDIVSFAELEQHMDQKLKNYSSGMQVRLAFSVAVRAKADVLLIDEVLAVGDTDFQRKCYDYFKKIKKEKVTVILVSHNMDAISEYCDRAALIENNEVKIVGSSSKVSNRYTQLFLDNIYKGKNLGVAQLGSRWGNGNVIIKDIQLSKKVLTDSDKTLSFAVKLEAIRDNSDLMVGFNLKNATGQLIHGANTWSEKKKLPKIEVGHTSEFTWQVDNFYADGLYSIDFFVYGTDNTVYDFVEDAVAFQVTREDKSGYLIKLPAELKTKQLD